MTEELNKKVAASIKLLQTIQKAHAGEQIELAYSGGKDSDVILQLAKEAGINYRAIYKNTTIDPRGTIAHVKAMGVEIRQPKKSFFEIVAEKGMPNRFARFCCSELKEYKILDTCIMGVRKAESTKRAKRYTEPTECRIYSKKDHVEAVYPILDWSNDDVREFIIDRKLQLAPVYYDAEGSLHTERRLGCVGCPLVNKRERLAQFKQYPNMIKALIRAKKKYRETHPNSKLWVKYDHRDVYEELVHDLFCPESYEKYQRLVGGGMFGDRLDCKKYLEDYFNIKFKD